MGECAAPRVAVPGPERPDSRAPEVARLRSRHDGRGLQTDLGRAGLTRRMILAGARDSRRRGGRPRHGAAGELAHPLRLGELLADAGASGRADAARGKGPLGPERGPERGAVRSRTLQAGGGPVKILDRRPERRRRRRERSPSIPTWRERTARRAGFSRRTTPPSSPWGRNRHSRSVKSGREEPERIRIDVEVVGTGRVTLPGGPREVVLQRALIVRPDGDARGRRRKSLMHRWIDPKARNRRRDLGPGHEPTGERARGSAADSCSSMRPPPPWA